MSKNKNPKTILDKIKRDENKRLYLLDMIDPFGIEQSILDTFKEIEHEFPEMIERVDLTPTNIPPNDNEKIK